MRWLLVLVLFCQIAFGQSLISVPTGDVLEKGALSVDAELDSGSRMRSPENLALTTWRYGLAKWLTVGLDVRLTRRLIATPNFSLRLLRSPRWSVAFGVENVGVRSFGEQPYLTASLSSGRARFHCGWTNDERDEAMLGIEWRLTRRSVLQSDFITGSGNFFAFGVQWNFSEVFGLTVAFLLPNDHRKERGFFLDLNWLTYWRHR